MRESYEEILAEKEQLRRSLEEAQELLRAISSGEVDALVLSGPKGDQVFTIEGADRAYRVLIEAMNDGAVTMTSDGTVLYCNKHFAEMVKCPLEKVIGSTFCRFIPKDDQAAFRAFQQEKGRGELTLQAEDKSILPVYISVNSLQISESQEDFCVVVTDLTEQKQKEEIVAAEKLARSIIEQATEAVVVCNSRGKIIRFSNAVSGIVGCDPMLKSFDDLFDLHLPIGNKLSPVSAALHGEVIPQVETVFESVDGTLFNLLLNAGPLKGANGKIIGCVITLTDITKGKKAENALEEANEGLEVAAEELRQQNDELLSTQSALQESQTILKTIIESTPDYISLKDREGRYVMVNSAASESLGLSTGISKTEIIGKKDDDIFPPEVACLAMDVDRQVISSGEIRAYDQSFTIQDEPRFFSSIKSPFRDGEGNVAGVVSVSRDITVRKRMEDELRTQADLLDRAPVLIFDLDDKVIFWNTGAEEMYGWTSIEAKSKGIHDLLATEFPKPLEDIKSQVMSTGHWKGEVSQLRRDGSRIYVASHWILYMDRQGKPTAILEINNDVTALKKAEEELREARDYLENLIDYANAPIIVWDASFNITRFNHAFERLTDLDAQDVLGKPLEILFPESSKDDSLELIKRTSSGERWDAVEIPILKTDGSVRTVLWNSANVYGKDRTAVVATIAQGQDITERKQAEEGLIKARDELELKVQERTADLQNALVAAEESVMAKAAFLANMSHELRTPLNAVIGFSSLLLDDNLTQDQNEYIEGIRKGGEAQLAIIDDILEFSRTEKDKIELEHQPFSLKHLIDESLDMVATQASKKGLNLSETINYGTPDTIIGDHGRLRQILVNLLGNAVKFTDKGDVSVSVSSKAVEGVRHHIFFAVKDTGIGIPHDKMNEIFEPFAQVERTLSRKRDGVGLGLAITKNLVQLMGGTIWVESIQDEGTTFSFTIQAETIPGRQLNFVGMHSGMASEKIQGLKTMRILVAEDNPSNQRVLVEMLKRLGYRADAVADGQEVVQALKRRDYDLVLMDIKMPEMDGITATQVIRKLRPENGPKIVAITAFALEGDREKCLDAGMDDYIAKPVQMRELAEVLKKNQPSGADS